MNKFKPDMYVKSIKDIPVDKLKNMGIKLACIDLDNTLDYPDRHTTVILDEANQFLNQLSQSGIEVLIVSNNSLSKRVESFAKIVKLPYVAQMNKPFQNKYKANTIINQYSKDQIVFIGDKLITDVLGGNFYGSVTVLTDPLFSKSNKWYVIIMVFFEKIFQFLISFKRKEYYNKLEEYEV